MTKPDDPDSTTRARGESLWSIIACTEPVPEDPDEELTHTRGEGPSTRRMHSGPAGTEPSKPEADEPVTKARGESPWLMTLPSPRPHPDPNRTNSRGESRRVVLGTSPQPPRPDPDNPRTAVRGENSGPLASTGLTPVLVRGLDGGGTAMRAELAASSPRPEPTPRPEPREPIKTFVRGEAWRSEPRQIDAAAASRVSPMTVLGALAARQGGR